jgi:choline-glycine betaine transporter
MLSPDDALAALQNAKSQTTYFFTWFFIVSRPLFIFFVLYVAYKYGHIKLGLQDSTSEFSNVTYFAMVFSAGVFVGLFFFGVSEPLWFQSDTYIANQDYRTQDEINQNAILTRPCIIGVLLPGEVTLWSPLRRVLEPTVLVCQ